MILGELLELLRESILNDRTDRIDGSSDYLWKDTTLVTFINEAQRKFAVESLILRDGTTDAATLVTLVEGQTIYPLHPAVIAVLSAQKDGVFTALTRVGHSLFSVYRNPTDRWVDPSQFETQAPNAPLAFSTDEALNADAGGTFNQITMRIYPTPRAEDAGTTLRLRVVRKPLVQLSVNSPDASPEIPDDHHIEMLDWAAYLALRIVDDDAGSPAAADRFAARFALSVTRAKKIAMAKLFAPMGWGFGRGGYTWDN